MPFAYSGARGTFNLPINVTLLAPEEHMSSVASELMQGGVQVLAEEDPSLDDPRR